MVWLSEEKREHLLSELHDRAGDRYPPALVFSGNTAADLDANQPLARLIETPAVVKSPVAWLGDPVAIKDPTAAVFRQTGGTNLLMIGQNEIAARGLFASTLVSLATQLPPELAGPAFTILDGTPDDVDEAEYLAKLAAKLPHAIAPPRSGLPGAVRELALELDRRQKGESSGPLAAVPVGVRHPAFPGIAEDGGGLRLRASGGATASRRRRSGSPPSCETAHRWASMSSSGATR